MSALPAKRLLVYVALGIVVLLVGVLALLSMGKEGEEAQGSSLTVTEEGMLLPGGAMADAGISSTTSTTLKTIFVQVAGAVRRPGVYQMSEGARVFQAVEEAGGFIQGADQQALTLAALLTDGCRVYVPLEGETPEQPVATIDGGGSGSAGSGGGGLVSLNSATLEELDALPGVGPSTAQKIITYREANGPFISIDQLTEVPGIGPAKLEDLRPLVGL